MEDMACLLVALVIACLLTGPAALIISIIALNKIKEMRVRPEEKSVAPRFVPDIKKPEAPTMVSKPEPVTAPPPREDFKLPPMPTPPPQVVVRQTAEKAKKQFVSLEQKIGTQWVLIAGVITVFIAAGFFLKFAYEHHWIGPWGRIAIAAFAGFVSLAIGEITRRRGYEIAAKGTTALGFAILYAADFAAYRLYELIGTMPAFATAILITVSALAYAVVLNEVIIAFLALLGGFLTPVMVSTGENMPVPLFGYVLVLSTGAMLCAYRRKWRVINLLALLGTFSLYTGWFEKFFRPQLSGTGTPEQLSIALGWLGVFFGIYLVLPLLYSIVNRIEARLDDVCLVVINALWTFYYLWTILFERYQASLALATVGLSAVHFAMMGLVFIRCREDKQLRQALLIIGLAFLTTAIPLYWKLNAAAIGWTIEGVILVFIGTRYRSILTQIGGATALVLACAMLVWQLPMHNDAFRLVLNPAFGIWVLVSAAFWLLHFPYRRNSRSSDDLMGIIAQLFYEASVLILFCAATLEWSAHCKYNLGAEGYSPELIRGQIILFSAGILGFVVRPLCPPGALSKVLAAGLAVVGSAFTASLYPDTHTQGFLIFVNPSFASAGALILSLFLSAYLLNRKTREQRDSKYFAAGFTLLSIIILWVVLSEEIYMYWYCRNSYVKQLDNWEFIANMWMSVAWAIYGLVLLVCGFWRKLNILRYLGLGVFGTLLIKVFVIDMSAVSTIYRIMAFLATGVTLVGVSYLYQFLRKKGFFDTEPVINRQSETPPS